MAKENEPTNKFRLGTVCVSEWTNEIKEGENKGNEVKNWSIDASYYDKKDSEFKETKSLSRTQLQNLSQCIDLALQVDVANK